MTGWLRRHPLAAFLPLEALLCFWNLGLLSPWGDEAWSLLLMRLPVREVLDALSRDYHPPLYCAAYLRVRTVVVPTATMRRDSVRA